MGRVEARGILVMLVLVNERSERCKWSSFGVCGLFLFTIEAGPMFLGPEQMYDRNEAMS
jgi:hypothetical protein